jgi:drug/metabolite transporter (DMT)-like permease
LTSAPLTTGEAAARARGIAIYCFALLCFACLDALAKYTSRYVPAIEVAWIRFVGHAIAAILFLRPWRDLARYRSNRPVVQLLRSVFLFSSTVFNFLALRKLQLAETISINFAGAFVIAGVAGPLLGEWIGPRRWAAIAVGFAGVLIVTQPGSTVFQTAVLLSIAAMLCNSGYVILTRMLAASDSSAGMLIYPALAGSIFLAPPALAVGVMPPTAAIAAMLAITGIFGAVGHFFLIEAHGLAPAPVLAPFMYTEMIWMVGLGYLVFGDVPGLATIAGAAVIILSGLYILYRERVHGDR